MAKAKRKYPNWAIESAARATLEAVKRFIAENPGVVLNTKEAQNAKAD